MSSDSNRKYLILVPDGMSDIPGSSPTPMESARTPWMDKIASLGELGIAETIPKGMDAGSDVANLAIMGYSPSEIYTGRAPFEAISMGISLKPNDLAFRLNLVTLERNFTMMADHSSDHISTPEAHEIARSLEPEAEHLGLKIYPGVSYRNLLVWTDGPDGCITHPPHDIPGEPIAHFLPKGPGADVLIRLMLKSWKILENHPVNQRRAKRCQGTANSVWPWGQGRPPKIPTLKERFGIEGSVVAAVDLIRGIGKYAGLDIIDVIGATGYLDTNYEGKVEAALKSLENRDFVYLHVEAPDEAGHSGQKDLKIKAIEDFDNRILGPILTGLEKFAEWRILLMPDHCTPVNLRTHTSDPVPYVLLDSANWKADATTNLKFSETTAKSHNSEVQSGQLLINRLLNRESA